MGGPLAEGRSKLSLKAIPEQGRKVFQAEKRAKIKTRWHKSVWHVEGALGHSAVAEGRQQGAEAGGGGRQRELGRARPTASWRSLGFILCAQQPLSV